MVGRAAFLAGCAHGRSGMVYRFAAGRLGVGKAHKEGLEPYDSSPCETVLNLKIYCKLIKNQPVSLNQDVIRRKDLYSSTLIINLKMVFASFFLEFFEFFSNFLLFLLNPAFLASPRPISAFGSQFTATVNLREKAVVEQIFRV